MVGKIMSSSEHDWVAAEELVSFLISSRPDGADIPDIADLVQADMDRTGDSSRALQRRSEYVVHHSQWSKWVKNQIKEFPEVRSIRAAAATLSVEETAVVLAFAKSLGLEVSLQSLAPGIPIPAGAEAMTGPQKRAIWDTIKAFLPPVTEAQAKEQIRRHRKPPTTP